MTILSLSVPSLHDPTRSWTLHACLKQISAKGAMLYEVHRAQRRCRMVLGCLTG